MNRIASRFSSSLVMALLLSLNPLVAQESAEEREAALAEAAENGEEHAEEHFNVDLWKWANFAILAGIIGYFAFKHGGAFFEARGHQIRRELEEAAEQRRLAEERYAAVETRLANLNSEIENLRGSSRTELYAELTRLSGETAKQMAKIEQQTASQIESALAAAQAELRDYTSRLSVELAEERLRERWTPDAEQRLIDQFLKRLEKDIDHKPSA